MTLFKRIPFYIFANINFIVLGIWGIVMRLVHLYPIANLNYNHILQAHSHFAFSGWMFLSLAFLIVTNKDRILPRFRNLFDLCLIVSFGMLIVFSIQGYKLIPILLSTIFIFITWRFAYLTLKEPGVIDRFSGIPYLFVAGAVFCLIISAIGPFVLGTLMSSKEKYLALYQSSIYFYMHFQMNGWMLLAALALAFNRYIPGTQRKNRRLKNLSLVFIIGTIPGFLIFVLPNVNEFYLNVISLFFCSIHLLAWLGIISSCAKLRIRFPGLVIAAGWAITLKLVLQVLVSIPAIGEWVFVTRNLIVAYIHLLTLGCIMPFIMNEFIQRGFIKNINQTRILNGFFLVTVSLYLFLLFIQPFMLRFGVIVPAFKEMLVFVSFLLVLSGAGYLAASIQKEKQTSREM